MAEGGSFFRQHTDDSIDVSADSNDFADRRFVREQSFLDYLSNNNHASGKLDVFISQIATITECVCVRSEETFIGSRNEKTRSCFYAVIDRLPFHFVAEAFEANLARLPFHQSVIMQRLLVGDAVAIAKFFLHVATRAHIGGIFGELKDIGTEEANSVLNRILQCANGGHD